MTEDSGDIADARDKMRAAYAEYHKTDNPTRSAALDASLHKIALTVRATERALENHGLTSCNGILPVEEGWTWPKTGRVQ
jgi:hypothetical protein